jgi:hypothetical protein
LIIAEKRSVRIRIGDVLSLVQPEKKQQLLPVACMPGFLNDPSAFQRKIVLSPSRT